MVQLVYDDAAKLAQVKGAVKKLLEINAEIENLVTTKLQPRFSESLSLFQTEFGGEGADLVIRQLTKDLAGLIKIAKKKEKSAPAFTSTIQNLEKCESLDEFVTLTSLTALADYKENLNSTIQIKKLCEDRVYPLASKLTNLIRFAAELDAYCKSIYRLLDCNEETREDDMLRMIDAIQNTSIDKFNTVYEKVRQRIEFDKNR